MRIYVDNEYNCHSCNDGTMREFEVSFFDGKCAEFVEGYRTALASAKNSDAMIIAKTYFTVKNGEFDLDITGINGEYKVGIKGGLKSTISEIKLRK